MIPDDIDDQIDAWHELPPDDPRSLHEYLGLSWEEYKIIARKITGIPMHRAVNAPGKPYMCSCGTANCLLR